MIEVQIRRSQGSATGFSITGHAGYRPKGSDIVCAAVSALSDTVALALERVAGIPVRVKAGEGRLECEVPDDLAAEARERANLLIETMLLGMEEISRAYPDRLAVRGASGKRGESNVPV